MPRVLRGRTSAPFGARPDRAALQKRRDRHVEGNWSNVPGEFYTKLELAGKDGLIRFDSRETDPIVAKTQNRAEIGAVAVNPYRLELEDMLEAIRQDRAPAVSATDACGSLEIALAAMESARTGQVMEL